jgi:hypothetical protein
LLPLAAKINENQSHALVSVSITTRVAGEPKTGVPATGKDDFACMRALVA